MPSFSFKKEPKETGLRSVGNPFPNTQIKYNKLYCGDIVAPTWLTPDGWRIRFSVKDGEGFRWTRIKTIFEDESSAREYVKTNAEKILKLDLYFFED